MFFCACISKENKIANLPNFELKIIRTFHNPIIFKYDSYSNELIGIVYSGRGGFIWGKINYENKKELDQKEMHELLALLNSLDINKLMEKEMIFGDDGSSWELIIGKNAVISKWTPTTETNKRNLQSYVAIGKYLWKITGIKENIKEIY